MLGNVKCSSLNLPLIASLSTWHFHQLFFDSPDVLDMWLIVLRRNVSMPVHLLFSASLLCLLQLLIGKLRLDYIAEALLSQSGITIASVSVL
uniref:Uncharacterized protein n=1 Tax=Anguilla anguilla TaxID=7936 RepID=A0A0E9S1G3_ANGAN